MRIVFATGNEGKMREVRRILSPLQMEILSMKEAGVSAEPEETGSTFEENACIKAKACAARLNDSGTIVMADDSGLEVDALGKEPGIYSSRFMGEDTPYTVKNMTIVKRLEGVPDEERTARFVCAIAAVMPDGTTITAQDTIEGRIGYGEKGNNGFGYDPIFYLPDRGCTTAELTADEKNKISHRGKALQKMSAELQKVIEGE